MQVRPARIAKPAFHPWTILFSGGSAAHPLESRSPGNTALPQHIRQGHAKSDDMPGPFRSNSKKIHSLHLSDIREPSRATTAHQGDAPAVCGMPRRQDDIRRMSRSNIRSLSSQRRKRSGLAY